MTAPGARVERAAVRLAYHEAGHAVAAALHSYESDITCISVSDRHGGYFAWHGEQYHKAFYHFAGPWCEARLEWSAGPSKRTSPNYHHTLALKREPEDRAACLDALGRGLLPAILTGAEETWAVELEEQWGLVDKVAGWLLCGETVLVAAVTAELPRI